MGMNAHPSLLLNGKPIVLLLSGLGVDGMVGCERSNRQTCSWGHDGR